MLRSIQLTPTKRQTHLFEISDSLEAIHSNRRPHLNSTAWPTGLDRSIYKHLPLTIRILNSLSDSQIMEGCESLTVKQLLKLPNFGATSLRHLLTTLETFLKDKTSVNDDESLRTGSKCEESACVQNTDLTDSIKEHPASWDESLEILKLLFATASELYRFDSLGDFLNPQIMALARRMDILDEVEQIDIENLIGDSLGLASSVLNRLIVVIENSSEMEQTIIKDRLLGRPSATLSEIGEQFGVTRERIRQIQVRLERMIWMALGEELDIITYALNEQLGCIGEASVVEDRVNNLFLFDHKLAKQLIRESLLKNLGIKFEDGVYYTEQAEEKLFEIKNTVSQLVDDDGLVDKQECLATLSLSELWQDYWPWVCKQIGIFEFFDSLSIRKSDKAQVKAALVSIGHPTTKEVLAQKCGVSEAKAGSHLSVLSGVVRASKDLWGLKEWIPDEYDGIANEIVKRINDGGGIAKTDTILEELTTKFKVSPISVNLNMQMDKFVIEDGWISLASKLAIRLRNIEDVIDGRDTNGNPYWTFQVRPRFYKGYSLTNVPPEIAYALGCAPDSKEKVNIENFTDLRPLTLNWPLASNSGVTIGYLSEPLRHLGINAGEFARITIKGPCVVELTAENNEITDSQTSDADVILSRLMERRKVI